MKIREEMLEFSSAVLSTLSPYPTVSVPYHVTCSAAKSMILSARSIGGKGQKHVRKIPHKVTIINAENCQRFHLTFHKCLTIN